MKLVKAYISTYFAHDTIFALEKIGVPRVSVSNLEEIGPETDQSQKSLSSEFGLFSPMVKCEISVNDDKIDSIIAAILKTARTGEHGAQGDGIIAVSPVEDVISIRTGEKGAHAL